MRGVNADVDAADGIDGEIGRVRAGDAGGVAESGGVSEPGDGVG